MTVQLTTLSNGFRIVTDTVKTVETVSLGVWIGAGSRYETTQNNGVAHFLEHMAFKGTEKRSAFEIAQSIESVGGYLNAYTSREVTAYYAKILKEDTDLAIDILGDILQNSIFDPKEISKEREVILQEINQTQDTPDDVVFDHFQETAYPSQALGRTILGPAKNVRAMTRETLINFMKTYYRPSQMIFSAAGNLDHQQIVDKVQTYFNLNLEDRPVLKEAGCYKGGNFREEKDLEQLHLVLGFEGISSQDPDFYTSSIYSAILGGGMSSRLFQEVREKRGLVYSIYSFNSCYRDTGIFGIYAGTGKKDAQELIKVITQELHNSTHTIKEEELKRAKAQLKTSLLMGLEAMSQRARSLAQFLLVFGRVLSVEELIQKVESTSLDQVHNFSKRILNTPLTLTALGPLKNLQKFEDIRKNI